MKLRLICSTLAFGCLLPGMAQDKTSDFTTEVHGTIRAKYEYQPDISAGRFEVRNARFSLSGNVNPSVAYKAEIDLSDEGSIKMLDAYTRLKPIEGVSFTIGQMRVPFTIDAHRSPHQQYFANRSFIAKQVGNVRDVGATLGYTIEGAIPVILEGGLFNGSGLTGQKDYWTKEVNYSAKAQFLIPQGFNVTLSVQKIKPENYGVVMYDAGAYWHNHGWHIEAEYLLKQYAHNAFDDVHAFDGVISYDQKMKRDGLLKKISYLARFDYMSNHSDGKGYIDGSANAEGPLIINDYERKRLTGGFTLSLDKAFISDIRINYEKYFYGDNAKIKVSEQDKFVIEVMTRF